MRPDLNQGLIQLKKLSLVTSLMASSSKDDLGAFKLHLPFVIDELKHRSKMGVIGWQGNIRILYLFSLEMKGEAEKHLHAEICSNVLSGPRKPATTKWG